MKRFTVRGSLEEEEEEDLNVSDTDFYFFFFLVDHFSSIEINPFVTFDREKQTH